MLMYCIFEYCNGTEKPYTSFLLGSLCLILTLFSFFWLKKSTILIKDNTIYIFFFELKVRKNSHEKFHTVLARIACNTKQ